MWVLYYDTSDNCPSVGDGSDISPLSLFVPEILVSRNVRGFITICCRLVQQSCGLPLLAAVCYIWLQLWITFASSCGLQLVKAVDYSCLQLWVTDGYSSGLQLVTALDYSWWLQLITAVSHRWLQQWITANYSCVLQLAYYILTVTMEYIKHRTILELTHRLNTNTLAVTSPSI